MVFIVKTYSKHSVIFVTFVVINSQCPVITDFYSETNCILTVLAFIMKNLSTLFTSCGLYSEILQSASCHFRLLFYIEHDHKLRKFNWYWLLVDRCLRLSVSASCGGISDSVRFYTSGKISAQSLYLSINHKLHCKSSIAQPWINNKIVNHTVIDYSRKC